MRLPLLTTGKRKWRKITPEDMEKRTGVYEKEL
jgi:hypothetical protein